jgi:hypothetical protein
MLSLLSLDLPLVTLMGWSEVIPREIPMLCLEYGRLMYGF